MTLSLASQPNAGMAGCGREANGSFPINSAVRTPVLADGKHMIADTARPAVPLAPTFLKQ